MIRTCWKRASTPYSAVLYDPRFAVLYTSGATISCDRAQVHAAQQQAFACRYCNFAQGVRAVLRKVLKTTTHRHVTNKQLRTCTSHVVHSNNEHTLLPHALGAVYFVMHAFHLFQEYQSAFSRHTRLDSTREYHSTNTCSIISKVKVTYWHSPAFGSTHLVAYIADAAGERR
jgi:hypothetical protein